MGIILLGALDVRASLSKTSPNTCSEHLDFIVYSTSDRYFDCTKTLLGISKLGGPKSVYLDIT